MQFKSNDIIQRLIHWLDCLKFKSFILQFNFKDISPFTIWTNYAQQSNRSYDASLSIAKSS